jgi:D-alanyl-D-alanine carboxypeptidase
MSRVVTLLAAALIVASCSSSAAPSGAPSDAPRATAPRVKAPPPTAASPTTAPVPATVIPPAFDGTVSVIDAATRARMTASWRPGCPVPLEDLRLLTLDHWGFDGVEHRGELVVHADHADPILDVFGTLFDARFPIERVELVDAYGGDDHASTRANNTSAFNCRWVVGKPGVWSEHASGRAIDVNPLVNPYVLDPRVGDPALSPYLDRSIDRAGMIRAGDVVVRAFAAIGWEWGGAWSSPDSQHFSATGR